MAFVVDVNGNRGPNSEQQATNYKDIRSFNGAHFLSDSSPCNQFKVGSAKYCILDSYSPMDCTKSANKVYCTGIQQSGNAYTSTYTNDYWAGAKLACEEFNATLPTESEFTAICNHNKNNKYNDFGISSGEFYTSTIGYTDGRCARAISFSPCTSTTPIRTTQKQVLCVSK